MGLVSGILMRARFESRGADLLLTRPPTQAHALSGSHSATVRAGRCREFFADAAISERHVLRGGGHVCAGYQGDVMAAMKPQRSSPFAFLLMEALLSSAGGVKVSGTTCTSMLIRGENL